MVGMNMTRVAVASEPERDVKKRGQLKSIWVRYKKNKLAMVGLVVFLLIVFMALFAPLITSYEGAAIAQDMYNRYASPSAGHILGTDQYGRDVFARIIFGARFSLSLSMSVIVISLTAGSLIGALAGYYGGGVDNVIMRLMDIWLAIPQILMAICIVAALGTGMFNLVLAMSVALIPKFARIVRSTILPLKGQEFIEAAKAYGTTDSRIILKYILPNVIGPIIVQATLYMAMTILNIAGLSFIGLGVSPPIPEWGSMLSEGKNVMRNYPSMVIIPGIAIMLTALSLNLVGDGLRDALDPRMKN